MADILGILNANYKAMGSLAAPRGSGKYVAVDPKLYQGNWSSKYANGKSFTLSVTNVNGFRATVSYRSEGTLKHQDVMIKDQSFRIGDTKFTLTKPGVAEIKNVVTDPATGSTYLDTAYAKQS